MKTKILVFLMSLVFAALSSVASAATIFFNQTECPTCENVTTLPTNEWSAFGLTISNAYWYDDSRDTFDQMGLSIETSPGMISLASASTNATIDWWVIGGFTGTYNAYNAAHGLLGSLFVDATTGGDQLGTYTFTGQVSSLEWFGDPGYAQISTLTVTPVPEPEIYAMMGLGLGMMGWIGRRRRLQAA